MNINALELNRLVVLHTVLTERSVTRAAAALHVTPAAVSNTLARLRTTFNDPLLVRNGRGLVPTPRAVALAPQLASAVASITRLIEDPWHFDPARSTRIFTLASSQGQMIYALPQIATLFAHKLPNARLRVDDIEQSESQGGLSGGDVDAAIAPALDSPLRGIQFADLYQEERVVVVRKTHPSVRRSMSKEQFNTLRHIDVPLYRKFYLDDDFFSLHGLRRSVAMSVRNYVSAAVSVAQTDLVVVMPRRVAMTLMRQLPLRLVALPAPRMTHPIRLLWHERTDLDPGAQFFRSLILSVYKKQR